MEPCLLCGKSEYKTDNDYICSSCVHVMLDANQEDLKRAYNNAIEKSYMNKATAIESFLIPEDKPNEQRKPGSKKRRRYLNRKGTVRSVVNKKERIKRSQVQTPAPVL